MIFKRISLIINLILGGKNLMTMVDVYVTLIINKRRTIDQVPAQLRSAVLADLNSLGFDGYGDLIVG